MTRDLADGDEDLRNQVHRLRDQLDAERAHAEQWRVVAEERRVTLEKLRQRRVVRVLLAVAGVVLPPIRAMRQRVDGLRDLVKRLVLSAAGVPRRATAPIRARRLARAIALLPTADPPEEAATAVVLTRSAGATLGPLVTALQATTGIDEVLVVCNAADTGTRAAAAGSSARLLELPTHHSYAAAHNLALEAVTTPLAVLVNDDVLPMDGGWFARMAVALEEGASAVGAQLVHPRRGWLDGRADDITVQHLGVAFTQEGEGPVTAVHLGRGTRPDTTAPPAEVAAVTGACLLVRTADWRAAGGMREVYDFGTEDVDLCWRLRASGPVCVVPAAVLWHVEGATRLAAPDRQARLGRQTRNWQNFLTAEGPAVRRAVLLDRVRATGVLADRPLRVGITVTRDDEAGAYGDLVVARGLAGALSTAGQEVRLLERYRDAWYDTVAGCDVVIVLHDTFDLRRVPDDTIVVAWVRNWLDRWLARPWFDRVDIALGSSATICTEIAAETGRPATRFPIAVDPAAFAPGGGPRGGVVLTASHWGADRGVGDLVAAVPDLVVYGRGWDDDPAVALAWRGALDHAGVAAVLGRSLVVVDQAAPHTASSGSLNSRVFEGLAAGALPVTNQAVGAAELFGDAIPVWETPTDLRALVDEAVADPQATAARVDVLRERVLAEHTWEVRVAQLTELLVARAQMPSIGVLVGAPDARTARHWGDVPYADDLRRALRRRGVRVGVHLADAWESPAARVHDVVVNLRGRQASRPSAGQRLILWIISHPEEVTPEELAAADLVWAAGPALADQLRTRSGTTVEVVPQATDAARFRPRDVPAREHAVLFVGNSRSVERPIVRDAVAAGLDLEIIGRDWERFVDTSLVSARHLDNADLPTAYAGARIVLNDHWTAMGQAGIVSNRVLDVLAAEGCVVSDRNEGLSALFGNLVPTYDGTAADLHRVVGALLDDETGRRELGRRGRAAVLAAHTFDHRAELLLTRAAELMGRALPETS